ncbi:ATPase domain-containing protein [Granulicella sibirica]|uniref:Protein RecA n=1 Tax=Granulicella sibirica TaxID=2479048 RepID=A0A4Q0SXS7_9BACT|nr:ATPase domain-containing protein [Granulicella sibirica]RXH55965.1 RecA protein [Granulicella sibirica]
MSAAGALKVQIESKLARRIPGALTPAPRTIREVTATGIADLDAMLEGGLPMGAITEFVGQASSGRTTAAMAFCARTIAEGKVCAWVDVEDSFCPESAEANGVGLSQVLWVRCGKGEVVSEGRTYELAAQTGGNKDLRSRMPTGGGGGRHPRSEIRGLEGAVEKLLQSSRFSKGTGMGKPGTPGALNRTIWPQGACRIASVCAEGTLPPQRAGSKGYEESAGRVIALRPVVRNEQVNSDRAPKRRGETLSAEREATGASVQAARENAVVGPVGEPKIVKYTGKPWGRLDQALRAVDLLLQAGGFGAIVLDLGDVAVEFADRIPLATWFRYRTAADHSRTTLVVLTQRSDGKSCAGSSAGLVVRFEGMEAWAELGTVMAWMQFGAESARQRFAVARPVSIAGGKTPVRAAWECAAGWAGNRRVRA